MIFQLLLSLSYSLQRYCLCQPNRIGDACSLQKKCRRYTSQSEIIIYDSQTKFNRNLFSDINLSQKNSKTDQVHNFDSVFFEVFGSNAGSKKNNLISINMLDDMFLNITKFTIFGGEFNQAVRIQNINYSKISLEAQNILIIFENSDHVSFNKLSLRSSFLKNENSTPSGHNQTKLTVTANEVIGDSASLSSDYFLLIKTEKIQVSDKREFDISNNFGITAPVEIFNLVPHQFNFEDKKKKMMLADEQPEDQVTYKFFCISTSSRLSRSKELAECEKYSVPLSNYYTGRDADFLSQISAAEDGTVFRLYITLSTQSDPIRINFPQISAKNIILNFISADIDSETRIEIKGARFGNESNATLSLSKMDYALFDAVFLQTFNHTQLFKSPIHLNDATENTTLNNLITDVFSLSQFTESDIIINKTLTISKASPITIQGKIYLNENCIVNINQYSNFPFTRYNYETTTQSYYLTLSDSLEDQRFDLYFKQSIILNYKESDSIVNVPTLTFAGGKTIYSLPNKETIRAECPYINFTIGVVPIGINVVFGTGSEREVPFPHATAFTFLNDVNNTVLNLTINDFPTVKNGDRLIYNITDMYLLVFASKFALNVMTPETITTYLKGINEKFPNKTLGCQEVYHTYDMPFFVPFNGSCYAIGAYNLTLLNLDLQQSLTNITYENATVYVELNHSADAEKFPNLYDSIHITTNTNGNISFTINEGSDVSDLIPLQLNLAGQPNLYFDSSFTDEYSSSMHTLKINHGQNNLQLFANSIPIPNVTLNDPVFGVLFSNNENIPDAIINRDTLQNSTRYGPVIDAMVTEDINFPQKDFLANEVILNGSHTLTFEYYNKSRVHYTFKDLTLRFSNVDKKIGNTVNFKGETLKLKGNAKIIQPSNTPLTIEVDILSIDKITSIPQTSFSSPIIVHNESIINIGQATSNAELLDANDVQQIIFGEDSVTFVDQNGERSVPIQKADSNAQTEINIDQDSQIQLSVADGAESVPSNLKLNFKGNKADIDYDKSWNDVEIPDTFIADFENVRDVQISSEMMNLPDVKYNGTKNIQTTTHKQKYTKDLAFYIFIGLAALVFVVALILCIVGLTCCKYVEELDISSSAEGQSDIGVGELDGLPYTEAEKRIRDRDREAIKEAKLRQIEERKRKEEKRKKTGIPDDDLVNEEKELESFEDEYFKDEDDIYHNRRSNPSPPKKKKPVKENPKSSSETSEEFNNAQKKAQLNAASGGAEVPPPPPNKKLKPTESENDLPKKENKEEEDEEASYNESTTISGFSD